MSAELLELLIFVTEDALKLLDLIAPVSHVLVLLLLLTLLEGLVPLFFLLGVCLDLVDGDIFLLEVELEGSKLEVNIVQLLLETLDLVDLAVEIEVCLLELLF